MWLLLVFRDRVSLRQATFAASEYLRDALTGRPVKWILANAEFHPITITLPVAKPGMKYWIQNLGPHPVTVEASGIFSSQDVKGGSWVSVVKRKSGWKVRR